MFCRKCGNEILDDSVFCPKCGERVVTGEIEETAAATVSPVVSLEKTAEIVSNTPISAETAVLSQKKNKLKVILISIGALIAVLAVVFFAVILPEMHLDFYYDRDPETGEYVILGTVNDVKELNIPDTIWFIPVRTINDEAFINSSVESVSFGKNIRHIGMNAFRNCLELQTVKFSDKMEYDYDTGSVMIGGIAFGNCINLKTVQFPNIKTNIYAEAFLNCANLSKINFGNVDMINFRAFVSCVSLTEVNTNAELGESAFEDCTSLRSVYLRDANIPEGCFSGCTALESVHCSYNDGAIQEGAFNNCVNLSGFYVDGIKHNKPKDLEEIGITISNDAFLMCEKFRNPKPTTQHHDVSGTTFMGQTVLSAKQYYKYDYTTDPWNDRYIVFDDGALEVFSPNYSDYDTVTITVVGGKSYLSSDLGKTDFVHIGMTVEEVFNILGETTIRAEEGIVISYEMYGYRFDLSLSEVGNPKVVTRAYIQKSR